MITEYVEKLGKQRTFNAHSRKKLVIILHGYGDNCYNIINLESVLRIDECSDFIAPNGYQAFDEPSMINSRQWFSLVDRSMAAMLSGLRAASSVLITFIDAKIKELGFHDYGDVILVGFSQGAMLSLYTTYTASIPFCGVISYSGALILNDLSDIKTNNTTKILIIHGTDDSVVPPSAFDHACIALGANSIEFEAHKLNGMEHTVDERACKLGREFLASLQL